jgi:hypothetical protein
MGCAAAGGTAITAAAAIAIGERKNFIGLSPFSPSRS